MPRVAIVAAVTRELAPLLRSWNRVDIEYRSVRYKAYENPKLQAVAVCGGMGTAAARNATEALLTLGKPEWLISAGFAGGAKPGRRAGELFAPRFIVDSVTRTKYSAGGNTGVLLTSDDVHGVSAKKALSEGFDVEAVDMEGSAVADVAVKHGVKFVALKAISDEYQTALPPLARFIRPGGKFSTIAFLAAAVTRPGWWAPIWALSGASARASKNLSRELDSLLRTGDWEKLKAPCSISGQGPH
jgi:adenosylhomocysteine nucleosidase